MKKLIKGLVVVAMAAVIATPAFAKTASIKVGDKETKLDISGFAQVALINNQVNASTLGGNVAGGKTIGIGDYSLSAAGNTSFTLNRLQVNFTAEPSENIGFKSTVELGRNFKGDTRIVDAMVDLKYLKPVTFRVGQFALPIGFELEKSPYDLDFINYTLLTSLFAQRNRGIMAYGDITPNIDFNLGIANSVYDGNLTGVSNESSSDSKQLFGRLGVTPVKDLNLALFMDYDNRKGNPLALAGAVTKTKVFSWGLGGNYTYAGFGFEGAYADMKVAAANVGRTLKEKDLYGAITYKIPETSLQLLARYERSKGLADSAAVAGTVTPVAKVLTAGINWNFDKNARLQLQREFWTSNSALTPKANVNDVTMLQLSIAF